MKAFRDRVFLFVAALSFKAKALLGVIFLFTSLSACSLDASISNLKKSVDPIAQTPQSRKDPDFMSGQTVVTPAGFQVRAVFGEVPEKRISNGHELTVVIHE